MSFEDDDKPKVRVHTRSIEQVLSPIADQVSQLIIFDEKARQNGEPIPDLTHDAEAIGMAIQNLVKVGREAMLQGDEQLQSRMPAACEQVRKIVNLGEAIIELLAVAKQISTLEELVVVMRSIKESLIALARLAEARHSDLINASLRRRLLVANETLRKGSPLLISALHTYLQNKHNEQAASSRDYAVDQMLNATHEIIVAVSSTELDEAGYADTPGEFYSAYEDAQHQLLSAAISLDIDALEHHIDSMSHFATMAAHDAHRPEQEETVLKNIESVRTTLQSLTEAGEGPELELVADAMIKRLANLNQSVQTCVAYSLTEAQVQGASMSAPLHKLIRAASDEAIPGLTINEHAAEFEDFAGMLVKASKQVASMSKDARRVKLVEVNSEQLQSVTMQLVNAARLCKEENSASAAEHLALLRDTWSYRADVLSATTAGMADPEQVIMVAGDGLQNDLEAVRQPEAGHQPELVRSKAGLVEARVNHLLSVADGEVENSEDRSYQQPIEQAASHLRTALPKYLSAVEKASQQPDDQAVQAEVKMTSVQLKQGVQQLRYAIRGEPVPLDAEGEDGEPDLSFAQSNKRPSLMEQSSQTSLLSPSRSVASDDEASDDEHTTAATGASEATAAGRQSPPRASSTTVSPHKLLLDASQPPTGPIAKAAQSLKKEASQWSAKRNPMVSTASEMADAMSAMALLANDSSRRRDVGDEVGNLAEMIGTAKEIAERAKDIRRQALEIAEQCSDKRLKADLLYLCDRLPTISTQLKIIASVKAASANASGSSEADAMLVKNAQNLMETVQRTVRAAEAASLKSFGAVADTAAALIKWKRKAQRFLPN